MNISQHAFVPRTKIQKGKIYGTSGNLINSSFNDTFEPQTRYAINYALFPQDATTNILTYKVTYLSPYSVGGQTELPKNRVSPLVRESERIAFGNNYSKFPNLPRGMVFQIGWYDPQPAVLGILSMPGDVQITDITEESI